MATAKEVREKYGISSATLHQWRRKGLPYTGKSPHYQYDMEAVETYYQEHLVADRRKDSAIDPVRSDYKTEWEKERAENMRLKNRILKGELIEIAELEKVLIKRATAYKESLMRMRGKVAALVNEVAAKEVDKIIEDGLVELTAKWNGPKPN